MASGQIGGICFQVKGEVQPGENGTISKSVDLIIFLTVFLLKGYIWYRQGRAGGHGAASIAAGTGSDFGIRIQRNPSLNQSVTVWPSNQLMHKGGAVSQDWGKHGRIIEAIIVESIDMRAHYLLAFPEQTCYHRKHKIVVLQWEFFDSRERILTV